MARIKIFNDGDQKEFNHLATHPLQSWEWGEFRKSQGHQVVRLGLYQKDKLALVYQFTLHQIPHLPYQIGYLPRSPLPTKEVVGKLREIGQERKAIFIKLEPLWEFQKSKVVEFKRLGFIKGKPLFTKFTSVIDLTKSEEELLKSFKPKTRYNIHVAEKHGVEIKEDNSEAAFEEYLKLIFETTKRQGFYAHDERFHRQQWQILRPARISHLLTATYQGKTLAAFLLFFFGGKIYYPYGASSREHREIMAPTLLMWEAIRLGKKLSCTEFDLWGDIEPNPPPNHPYFGFHRFKEGFSPKLVEFVGTYDLVINPLLYKLYNLVDLWRWKILRLRSRLNI